MADHDDDGEAMTSTATTKTMRPLIITLITTIAWFVIIVENVMENVTVFALVSVVVFVVVSVAVIMVVILRV